MTDTCPRCCRRNVPPRRERTDGSQIRHAYRCLDCGHAWITSRVRTAYPAA